jgi:hypothetical protein
MRKRDYKSTELSFVSNISYDGWCWRDDTFFDYGATKLENAVAIV